MDVTGAAVDRPRGENRPRNLDLLVAVVGAAPCLNLELHRGTANGQHICVDGDFLCDMRGL
jgi:hypothetical protein